MRTLFLIICAWVMIANFSYAQPRPSVTTDTNGVLLSGTSLFAANSNLLQAALPYQINPLSTNTPAGITNAVLGIVTGAGNPFTNAANTFNGSAYTNTGIVWLSLATNGAPNVVMPSGSFCTTTNGQLFVNSNGVWLLK
jgi:hypothetical protein